MTKKEMNELADLIVDKLLTTYIREQAMWYTTSTVNDIYDTFKKRPKRPTKRQNIESANIFSCFLSNIISISNPSLSISFIISCANAFISFLVIVFVFIY